jgi:hypothetical protein
MAVRLSALRAGRPSSPGLFLVLISVRCEVDARAVVRLEGLGKLKKSTSSGIRSRELPACSVVPQPTTLPRTLLLCNAVHDMSYYFQYKTRILHILPFSPLKH